MIETTGTKADIGRSSYNANGNYKSKAKIIYSKTDWSLVIVSWANEIKDDLKDEIQGNSPQRRKIWPWKLEDTLDPRKCLFKGVNIETGFSNPRVDFTD